MLFQVNGQDMRGLDHKEAVNYLRQTPNTVRLRFSRPLPMSEEEEEEEDEEEEDYLEPPEQERKRVSGLSLCERYQLSSPGQGILYRYNF